MQPTAQPVNRSAGFTLVEMLVVVLIIAVLIGITVKILGGAGRQAAKAQTVNRMERLKHSIEEYYTEYGQYPPTQSFAYEYRRPTAISSATWPMPSIRLREPTSPRRPSSPLA